MPDPTHADYTPRSCSRASPCNRFYHCDHCARRRQARFADVAERIEAAFGPLQYAVVTPDDNTQHAIQRAKNAILRASDSPALIWSVEVGLIAQKLHLNLLGPNLGTPEIRNANVHIENCVKPARAVGAYITKRSAFPPRNLFDGRLVGTAGQIMQYLATADSLPVVQAGALLKILETARYNRTGIGLTSAEIHHDLHKIVQHEVALMEKLAARMRGNQSVRA